MVENIRRVMYSETFVWADLTSSEGEPIAPSIGPHIFEFMNVSWTAPRRILHAESVTRHSIWKFCLMVHSSKVEMQTLVNEHNHTFDNVHCNN